MVGRSANGLDVAVDSDTLRLSAQIHALEQRLNQVMSRVKLKRVQAMDQVQDLENLERQIQEQQQHAKAGREHCAKAASDSVSNLQCAEDGRQFLRDLKREPYGVDSKVVGY